MRVLTLATNTYGEANMKARMYLELSGIATGFTGMVLLFIAQWQHIEPLGWVGAILVVITLIIGIADRAIE